MKSEPYTQTQSIRILEIGFQPLLKGVFPDRVDFVDTRFRWEDVRTYRRQRVSNGARLIKVFRNFLHGLALSQRQHFDVVVVRCLGPVNSVGQRWPVHIARVLMGLSLELLARFAARGSVRLVVIDQTDQMTIHPRDRRFALAADLFFKRELAHNIWHSLETLVPRGSCLAGIRYSAVGKQLREKLRPLPLGIEGSAIKSPLPAGSRKFDILYVGTDEGIPVREALAPAMVKLANLGWKVFAPKARIPLEEFQEAVRQSRFTFSPAGGGWDCYRHYEVLALGSIPLFDFRSLIAFAPLQHTRHCFYFDPQGDIAAQVDPWLKLPYEEMDAIVQRGQEHLQTYLTTEALANYVMSEIENLCANASE